MDETEEVVRNGSASLSRSQSSAEVVSNGVKETQVNSQEKAEAAPAPTGNGVMASPAAAEVGHTATEEEEDGDDVREIRIFLCTTSSDMMVEKQVLQLNVFKDLREKFLEEGVEFQVIDLRHGRTLDPSEYFLDGAIHLEEIDRCRRVSCGINFMALLGHKYEPCLMPRKISKDTWRALTCNLEPDERAYLNKYYKRDNNAIPPNMCLAPEKAMLNTLSTEDKWNGFETARLLLKNGLSAAFQAGEVSADWAGHILESGLVKHTQRGLSDNRQAVVIKRTCINTENLNKISLHRFFDMLEEGEIIVRSDEYKQLIQNFRNKLVPKLKTDKRILDLSPDALPTSIVSKSPDQIKYLADLVAMVKQEVLTKALSSDPNDSTENEYSGTSNIFNDNDTEISVECMEVLESVRQKLPRSNRPFVITGPCGSGKTELLEHIYKRSDEFFNVDSSIVIWKSFNPQAETGCIVEVLGKLASSVHQVLRQDDTVPRGHSVVERAEHLRVLLTRDYQKPLVILLDGMENVPTTHNAHTLRWLPSSLGQNVHLILTISSGTDVGQSMLDKARMWIGDASRVFTVPSFSHVTASELLLQQLTANYRTLRPDQFDIIFKAFHHCSSPLLLRMALRESSTWRSYTERDEMSVKNSLAEAIKYVCRKCELVTSETLVRSALGNLTMARKGLSEAEIKDVMTLDTSVIIPLWSEGSYPAQRSVYPFKVPDIYWHRIYRIMEPYLVETPQQGRTLLSWRHQIVLDVVKDRYVAERENDFHHHLSEYFSGVWCDRAKQIHLKDIPYHVQCLVPSQPWRLAHGAVNQRKFAEYPYHLSRCGKSEQLAKQLLDASWLVTMTEKIGLCQVIQTFKLLTDQRHATPFTGIIKELESALPYVTKSHHLLTTLLSKFGCNQPLKKENGNKNGTVDVTPLLFHDAARQLEVNPTPALLPQNACLEGTSFNKGAIPKCHSQRYKSLSRHHAMLALADSVRVRVYHLSGQAENWMPLKEYIMPREKEEICGVELDHFGAFLLVQSTIGGDAERRIARLYETRYHHCVFTEENVTLATIDQTGKWFVLGQQNGAGILGTEDKKRRYSMCYPEQSGRLQKLTTSSDGHIIAQFAVGKLVVYASNGKMQNTHRILYHGYGGEEVDTTLSNDITWQWGLTKNHLIWYTTPKGVQLNIYSIADDVIKSHKLGDRSMLNFTCDEESNLFVVCSDDDRKPAMQVWDAHHNKVMYTLKDMDVSMVGFLRGKRLMLVKDVYLEVWSLEKGDAVCGQMLSDAADDNVPLSVNVTNTGDSQLALVDTGNSIGVYDVTAAITEVMKQWAEKNATRAASSCMALSNLSMYATVGCTNGQIRTYDVTSGEEKVYINAHQKKVLAIACADPLLASSAEGEVCIWGLPALDTVSQYTQEGLLVTSMGFTNAGKYIVCLTREEVLVLDVQTMTPKVKSCVTFGPYDVVCASSDWSVLIGGDAHKGAGYVSFHHTHTGRVARSPSAPGDALQCMATSPAGKYGVVAYSCSPTENPTSSCIRIYDTKSTDADLGRYLECRALESQIWSMTLTADIMMCIDEFNMITIYKNSTPRLTVLSTLKLEASLCQIIQPSGIDVLIFLSRAKKQTTYTVICGKTGKHLFQESLSIRLPTEYAAVTNDGKYMAFLHKDGLQPLAGVLKQNLKLAEIVKGGQRKNKSRACVII